MGPAALLASGRPECLWFAAEVRQVPLSKGGFWGRIVRVRCRCPKLSEGWWSWGGRAHSQPAPSERGDVLVRAGRQGRGGHHGAGDGQARSEVSSASVPGGLPDQGYRTRSGCSWLRTGRDRCSRASWGVSGRPGLQPWLCPNSPCLRTNALSELCSISATSRKRVEEPQPAETSECDGKSLLCELQVLTGGRWSVVAGGWAGTG